MIGFKQDIKAFFSSKSNWTALSMIIGSIVGLKYGQVDAVTAVQGVMAGLALISVKDAIAK